MTFEERTQAVIAYGFTERQAGFLVTVMLHAGVCLRRQYCAFAHIERGQKSHDFFERLVRRGYAIAYPCAHNRARLYHVHQKGLYRACGEPNNRHRRPTFLGRAVERLMLLDVVLAHPDLTWLATERDKIAHFTTQLGGRLSRDAYPHLTFGEGTATTVRYFPDKLPIGLDAEGRIHVFCYLVVDPNGTRDFRAFLHRHAELLRAMPVWAIRLLVPQHLTPALVRYRHAFRDELITPLSPPTVEELRWYFRERTSSPANRQSGGSVRYQGARQAFATPRYRALYRAWVRTGDHVLDAARSPVLADAVTRGSGRLETYVLPHRYLHLLPLVGTA